MVFEPIKNTKNSLYYLGFLGGYILFTAALSIMFILRGNSLTIIPYVVLTTVVITILAYLQNYNYPSLLPEKVHQMKLKPIKTGFHHFGQLLNNLINCVLLSVVYILGIGITSIVAKIINKNFLESNIDHKQESYWKDLNLSTQKKEEYYHQF